MNPRTRQITIVALVILTVGLIGAAVYLGISIQNNQAPTDSNAAGGGQTCTAPYSCQSPNNCQSGTEIGTNGAYGCGGTASCCKLNTSGGSCTSTAGCTAAGVCVGGHLCVAGGTGICAGTILTNTGGSCGSCTSTAGCTGVGVCVGGHQCVAGGTGICAGTILTNTGATCGSSSSSSSSSSSGGSCSTSGAPCSTTCGDGTTFSDACPSTFGSCSAWAAEACQGHTGSSSGTTSSSSSSSGGGGNVGSQVVCGGSCNSTADCKVSQFGFQPICQAGKCVSPICPTDYNADAQCACKTNSGKCGDKCGIWSDGFHPLCGAGSTCSWINGPSCAGNQNLTYCMPLTLHNGYTRAACAQQESYTYLIDPSGSPITTQAQILAACAPDPVCGDGVKNGVEQCDPTSTVTACAAGKTCNNTCTCVAIPPNNLCGDGVCNGNETNASCASDCLVSTLPNTAIISDEADAALAGGLFLILGLLALRFQAVDKTWKFANNSLKTAYDSYFGEDAIQEREMDKVKRSRSKYEEELENKINKKK